MAKNDERVFTFENGSAISIEGLITSDLNKLSKKEINNSLSYLWSKAPEGAVHKGSRVNIDGLISCLVSEKSFRSAQFALLISVLSLVTSIIAIAVTFKPR